MIDRQHGRVLIECDSCDEVIEGPEGGEFDPLWAQAKRDGWRNNKIDGQWLHGCPRCGRPT